MQAELIRDFPLGGRRSRALNDAGLVLLDTDDGAALWSAEGEKLWEHPVHWPFTCALAADGTAFVGDRTGSGAPSSIIRIDRDGTRHPPLVLPFDELYSIALSPDGQTLAALSDGKDTKPRLYRTADLSAAPTVLKKGNKAGRMQHVRWSPRGTRLLTLAEKSARTPALTVAVRDPSAKRGLVWHGIADNAVFVSETRLATWRCPVSAGTSLFALDAEDPSAPIATNALPGVRLYPMGNLMPVAGGRLGVSQNNRLYVLDGESLQIESLEERQPWLHDTPVLVASPSADAFLASSGSGTKLFRWHL